MNNEQKNTGPQDFPQDGKELTLPQMEQILKRDLNAAVTTFHLILTTPELLKLFAERVHAQVLKNIEAEDAEWDKMSQNLDNPLNSNGRG